MAPIGPPEVPPYQPVDENKIRAELEEARLTRVPVWNHRERSAARAAARVEAEAVIARRNADLVARHGAEQAEADAAYGALLANDHGAVMGALEAFEDNVHPAVPIDCVDGSATVVVVFGPVSTMPDAQLRRQGSAHQIVALPPDAVSGLAELIEALRASI